MSVIHETLDNLKKTKKRSSGGSLDPSSSAYVDQSEELISLGKNKSFLIPLTLGVFVGIFFIAYRLHIPSTPEPRKSINYSKIAALVQHAKHEKLIGQPTHSTLQTQAAVVHLDDVTQGEYYDAMAMLNDGNIRQARLRIEDIMKKHPDFEPARNVYSMLNEH